MQRPGPPILVSFSVTQKCNLKCPHCYSDAREEAHPKELTTEEAKQIIMEVAEIGTRLLIFDGGEPVLREDLPELVKCAYDAGLMPLLGSNGTLITKNLAHQLKSAGLRAVAVSLDGARAETHDAFRGRPGSWHDTLRGIKNCAEIGLPFQVAPCITRNNWMELPQIIERARELGAVAVEIFDYVRSGRGKAHLTYELDTELRKRMVEQIIELQRKDQQLTYRVIALPQYWVRVEQIIPEEEIWGKFVRTCCGAGSRYACILYEGTVYPCMVLQVPAGNVREQSFEEVWNESTIFQELRNRELLKGKCRLCHYKHVCGGARCKAYEMTGDYLAEDPTCWFTPEEVYLDANPQA